MHSDVRRLLVVGLLVMSTTVAVGLPWGNVISRVEAGGSWSAWLYSPTAQKLVHVFPDMPPVELQLPMPEAVAASPNTVAISPDGRLLAFCVTDSAANATIYVYDFLNMAPLFNVPRSNVAYCDVGIHAFRNDSSAFAVTILHNPTAESNGFPTWELVAIGLNAPNDISVLYQSDGSTVGAGANTEGMYPMVEMFQDNFVIFRLAAWMPGGGCETSAFYWNLSSYQVAPYEIAGHFAWDDLPLTGEFAWIVTNPSLPLAQSGGGPMCMGNMVMYGSKATQPYPIYVNTNYPITNVAFINGGQQLAIAHYAEGMLQWVALARDGSSYALPVSVNARALWNTMNGYFFLRNDAGGAQLVYQQVGVPTEQVLWQEAGGTLWTVAWVAPVPSGELLSPFPQISPGS